MSSAYVRERALETKNLWGGGRDGGETKWC